MKNDVGRFKPEMTLCADTSYIDLSPVVKGSKHTWKDIEILLQESPLGALKSSVSSYSILNSNLLGESLNDLEDLLFVYKFDIDKHILVIHHAVLHRVLEILDLMELYDDLHMLSIQAMKIGKRCDIVRMNFLKRADHLLFDFSEYFMMENVLIAKQLFYESYEAYKVVRHKDCHPATPSDCDAHGMSIDEHSHEIIGNMLQVVTDVICVELELCGETPIWKTIV